MSGNKLPLLVEPAELKDFLDEERVLVIDLSRADIHQQFHLPGARHLEYGDIVASAPPIGGLLPAEPQLNRVLGAIGLTAEHHVVAYDDEGGGKAARLLWTLDTLGHHSYSLLNGGLHAWAGERRPMSRTPTAVSATDYRASRRSDDSIASADYILDHLDDGQVALLDVRSPGEFDGTLRYAARGGHLPGAVNMEWTEAMDPERNLRLREPDALRGRLDALGIRPDQTVVAYCQSHHRSAHAWFWLKWIGYRAKGYPGSWSEWGNRHDTPVA